VVHVVLCLVLHSENIANLFSGCTYMTNTNINESSFASVAILDSQRQGDIIQRKIVRILAGTIELVVAVGVQSTNAFAEMGKASACKHRTYWTWLRTRIDRQQI
jgi:hypothetical protein